MITGSRACACAYLPIHHHHDQAAASGSYRLCPANHENDGALPWECRSATRLRRRGSSVSGKIPDGGRHAGSRMRPVESEVGPECRLTVRRVRKHSERRRRPRPGAELPRLTRATAEDLTRRPQAAFAGQNPATVILTSERAGPPRATPRHRVSSSSDSLRCCGTGARRGYWRLERGCPFDAARARTAGRPGRVVVQCIFETGKRADVGEHIAANNTAIVECATPAMSARLRRDRSRDRISWFRSRAMSSPQKALSGASATRVARGMCPP